MKSAYLQGQSLWTAFFKNNILYWCNDIYPMLCQFFQLGQLRKSFEGDFIWIVPMREQKYSKTFYRISENSEWNLNVFASYSAKKVKKYFAINRYTSEESTNTIYLNERSLTLFFDISTWSKFSNLAIDFFCCRESWPYFKTLILVMKCNWFSHYLAFQKWS